MYPFDAPEAAVAFVKQQFARFKVTEPSDRSIDKTIQYVLAYVAKNDYYPSSPAEAAHRYSTAIGLTHPECVALVPEIEIYLKQFLRVQISEVQLNLCLWASLLYCWAEEGERDVKWYKTSEASPFDTVYPGWVAG